MTDYAEIRETWRQIERDAREHALSVLDAEEALPLVLGAPIAWVNTLYGRTDELSPLMWVESVDGACVAASGKSVDGYRLTLAGRERLKGAA